MNRRIRRARDESAGLLFPAGSRMMVEFPKALRRLWPRPTRDNSNQVDMSIGAAIDQRRFIEQSIQCREVLARFVGRRAPNSAFVSLGENCSSAWYLKQIGLKESSYPFDWIFSSPEIILDCLDTRFETYLDKSRIIAKQGGRSAGHSDYHASFFSHRNPLASDDDYSYYSRCCSRFLTQVNAPSATYYVITLINEPSKRVSWAEGFNARFARPEHQDANTCSALIQRLKTENPLSRFVVIDHRTHGDRAVEAHIVNDDLVFIRFVAAGGSTGVYYECHLDDFCFKTAMTGLYGRLD